MAIPNQDKKINMSQKFNEDLKRHLLKLGWSDETIRDSFVAVMNSYMFSGTNASQQKVISNYLERGLDILNIELKRVDIQQGEDEVVQVTPDQVKTDKSDPSQKVESITYRKISNVGKRKNFSTTNILKEQLKSHTQRTKIIKEMINKWKNVGGEELKVKIIDKLLSENIIMEQGEVNKSNFRTFFSNYLNDDKSWGADATESLISDILEIVEKSSGNINAQKLVVRETDYIVDQLSKVAEIKTATQTKNSQIAFQELATLSAKLRGWSSEFYSEFVKNLMSIIGTASSQKIQSFTIRKISNINTKIKSKEEKEKDGSSESRSEEEGK